MSVKYKLYYDGESELEYYLRRKPVQARLHSRERYIPLRMRLTDTRYMEFGEHPNYFVTRHGVKYGYVRRWWRVKF